MTVFPTGKLPAQLLADLLPELPGGPRVVLGPRPGEDAAVIDLPDRYLVAKTDPITFATDKIGWYAVQVCANDIATTGATPLWFMATILLPENQATAQLARAIFSEVGEACVALNVAAVGGHTEIAYGLDRPIVVGCMFGEVAKERLVRTGGARLGDAVFLTKGAPIEATAIIARERRESLCGQFTDAMLDRCATYLRDPGISVVRDAQVAMRAGKVTSMHDPTEGGVITALWELAEASGCTLRVDLFGDNAPWLSEAVDLCRACGIDPAAAIASGALLLTLPEHDANSLRSAFAAEGIALFRLGKVHEGPPDVLDVRHGRLRRPERDEIARLYD